MISAPLQKAFMLLLRQGLWDRQEDCSALFPLDEKEWNEIHSMARKQTVQGIIYDGIRLLPTEAVPPRKVLLGWMVEVDTLERVNRQHRLIVVTPGLAGEGPAGVTTVAALLSNNFEIPVPSGLFQHSDYLFLIHISSVFLTVFHRNNRFCQFPTLAQL